MKIKITGIFLLLFGLTTVQAQVDNIGVYGLGHSLIDHTASDQTKIFHWMNDIAAEANHVFAAGGRFGQLPQQALTLPPVPAWYYNGVTSVWDDMDTFAESDVNTILVTAANFVQYLPPDDGTDSGTDPTVLEATEIIFDWLNQENSNLRYYIYLNWQEMSLQNDYPPTTPTQTEIDDFYAATVAGSFPDWWITYQDLILASRPQYNTRMIPVGPIISDILTTIIPTPIPFTDLYEDAAPHGKPTIYFLAGMITYMAMYEENIPSTYLPDNTVDQKVRDNMAAIRNFAWTELNNYNFTNGDSRVFYSTLPVKLINFSGFLKEETVKLSWLTTTEVDNYGFDIEYSTNGTSWETIGFVQGKGGGEATTDYHFSHSISSNKTNFYRLKQIDIDYSFEYSKIISINNGNFKEIELYPNPTSDVINLRGLDNQMTKIEIIDILGRIVKEETIIIKQPIDISELDTGQYTIRIEFNNRIILKRIVIKKR